MRLCSSQAPGEAAAEDADPQLVTAPDSPLLQILASVWFGKEGTGATAPQQSTHPPAEHRQQVWGCKSLPLG